MLLVAATLTLGIAESVRPADAPPPIRVTTAFDTTSAKVGDTVRYTVAIDYAPDVSVEFPQFPDTIAGLSVRNFGPLEKREADGRHVRSRWYEIEHFLAGSYTIPGVAVEYELPGKAKAKLRSADLFLEIESLIGEEELGEIRDIQPPLTATSRYAKYYYWGFTGAGLLVVAIVAGIIYQRHRARSRILGPPPVPAHELAYAQLEELLKMDLIAGGKIKAFYYRLSNIVRRYIENRFHLMAPERTTEEFLVEMAGTSLLIDAHKGLLATFLEHCDLVKYAKYAPRDDEVKATYDSAVRFVDETREETDLDVEEDEED